MRLVLLLVLAGCAPRATAGPDDPSHPKAETGRLAGPPPALRAGVVEPAQTRPPISNPAKPPAPTHKH